MDAATLAVLLPDVKRYLQKAWDDEDGDQRIADMIESGATFLDKKRGAAGDYTVPGFCRTLLFEYVRYARDGALDVFQDNYLSMILDMQHERRVEEYVAAQEALQAES